MYCTYNRDLRVVVLKKLVELEIEQMIDLEAEGPARYIR